MTIEQQKPRLNRFSSLPVILKQKDQRNTKPKRHILTRFPNHVKID